MRLYTNLLRYDLGWCEEFVFFSNKTDHEIALHVSKQFLLIKFVMSLRSNILPYLEREREKVS